MKNNLKRVGNLLWRTATEVPGWPNAPTLRRVRHSVPVLLPVIAVLGLLTWIYLLHFPAAHHARMQAAELVSLESEIAQLRLSCSDQQAAELETRAKAAQRRLIANAEEMTDVMTWIRGEAKRAGWSIALTKGESAPDNAESPALLFQTVRADFKPGFDNPTRLGSLVTLLERISSSRVRIDLIQTAIRVDDTGWQSVEVILRLARTLPNEKVAK